tara:strand:+ start:3698 stop:3826 length:129 start_codon:yes stop_codon:yes gene_type:complete
VISKLIVESESALHFSVVTDNLDAIFICIGVKTTCNVKQDAP